MEFQPGTPLAPPSNHRIAWFEMACRVVLPRDYVEVLKIGNGAVPLTNVFDQGGRERLIERMLCLLESPEDDQVNGRYDITVVITQVDSRLVDDGKLVGMNVIPIAALFGGDLLCLDYRSDAQSPVVAVWDHEQSEELQPHLETIAPSFKQFDTLVRR